MSPKPLGLDDAAGTLWEGNETVWHAWASECDGCGCHKSSLKNKPMKGGILLSCSGCLVAKYCSKECQKRDWSGGHKNQCHLFEANRKLSSLFAKSLGPGTINDQTLTLEEKLVRWNFLNIANHLIIAAAAVKNDPKLAGTVNVAILISLADEDAGAKYEHRTFYIDRVLLLSREPSNAYTKEAGWHKGAFKNPQKRAEDSSNDQFKLMAGWCELPSGETVGTQMWAFPRSIVTQHPPPWLRFEPIRHPRQPRYHPFSWFVLAAATRYLRCRLESAQVPPGWKEYAERNHMLLTGLKGGKHIIGRVLADGTRVPIYKSSSGGHQVVIFVRVSLERPITREQKSTRKRPPIPAGWSACYLGT
ncbi:hypothetical protein C8R43DRAFT_1119138 [Mycena crocata]|nr:hypothetical protein C8R43DRAFT_1119138 [Mycena crocata]